MSTDAPPPFEPHAIELHSVDASKIVGVSLFAGRAEITRLYKLSLRTGQNHVAINGLPDVLDQQSFRVEGRGAATIHDVALSLVPSPPIATTSPTIDGLLHKKRRTEKGLERCKKSLASLEGYLSALNVQNVNANTLVDVMEDYDVTGARLDEKALVLEKQLKNLNEQLDAERKSLGGTHSDVLRHRATISVFAEIEGEVEMALIYAVYQANWSAGYDIRVDTRAKNKPVTLIYKASITQNTGEAWNDVPLTLETATPAFGINIPTLSPWALSVEKPVVMAKSRVYKTGSRLSSVRQRVSTKFEEETDDDIDIRLGAGLFSDGNSMWHSSMAVSSRGISATYRVPGLIKIPSDNASHSVTIAQLNLDSTMSWVAVPKVVSKVHLKAKITNASDYTLLDGVASVYVDGSFISRSNVPLVSPQESFDCPLGLDPSIRVTYHPRVKKVSQSGFYTKTFNHVFSQRITIFNTKSTPVNDLKVIDQMPVSEDDQINVKLTSPSLVMPDPSVIRGNDQVRAPPPVKVSEGVTAQWEGADEQGFDMESLGKDGKFHWACSIPAQGKVNLVLGWEVSAPVRTTVVGMT